MKQNMFMPKGLPLLCDHALIKCMVEYRQAYAMLTRTPSRGSRTMSDQLRQALYAIEKELQERGINTEGSESRLAARSAPTMRIQPTA